ncbi:MAG: hypothetical protein PCFJNLEI_01289 [Verrucomicrobiae bacterium]|nr:hypothetical protein [Verrucomicrobiae bacterium]
MLKSGTKFLTGICLAIVLAALVFSTWERWSYQPALRDVAGLIQTERLDAAAAILDRFLQDHPADSDALRLRFGLFLKTERYGDALATYRQLGGSAAELDAALHHRDPVIRAGVARLIGDHDLPLPPATLIKALDDSDPGVRRYCAETLGQRRETSALKPLFRLLADDNWYVRATAAAALGQLGDPRAAGWLIQMLGETDALVRLNATVALRQVAHENNHAALRTALAKAKPAQQLPLAMALAKLRDPLALDYLTNSLTVADAAFRRHVAEALGDFPDATMPALQQLAADPDEGVRHEAQRVLQRLESNRRGL